MAAENFSAVRSAVAALKQADGGRAALVLGDWPADQRGRYEPLTGGMQAALPHVDAFVSGHSMAAFEELSGVIARA